MQNYNLKFKNSQDIKIRTYEYALRIIKFINNLPRNRTNTVLEDQLLRAATSIGANIIEGQSASSKREFINFINYSLKSSNECKFWIALLKDSAPVNSEEINILLNETEEISKILASIILNSKRNSRF